MRHGAWYAVIDPMTDDPLTPEGEAGGSDLPGASSEAPAPRRRWVAGLLSLLVAGLGQVYSGRWRRGLGLYALGWPLMYLACASLVWPVGFWVPLTLFALLVLLRVFIVGDAVGLAARAPAPYRLRPYNRWYVYGAIYLLSALAGRGAAALMRLQAATFSIPSASMEPTVLQGDRIVVDMLGLWHRAPRRGEIVVYQGTEDPRLDAIKRVVAVPGDVVKVIDKQLFISGKQADDAAYAIHADPRHYSADSPGHSANRDYFGPLTVPPATVFLMGDNRDISWDSRFWGPLPQANTLGGGRIRIYWSSDPATGSIRWGRIGSFVR